MVEVVVGTGQYRPSSGTSDPSSHQPMDEPRMGQLDFQDDPGALRARLPRGIWYLGRIGKEAEKSCHHCGAIRDDQEHTIEFCPAWHSERENLKRTIGNVTSTREIIKLITTSEKLERLPNLLRASNASKGGSGKTERKRKEQNNESKRRPKEKQEV